MRRIFPLLAFLLFVFRAPAVLGLPDLQPYTPAGWDGPLVVGVVSQPQSNAASIFNNQTVYFNSAFANLSAEAIAVGFRVQYLLDGAPVGYYDKPAGMASMSATAVYGSLGLLSSGSHTLEMIIDYNASVAESNEANNIASNGFTVLGAGVPDIRIAPSSLTFDLAAPRPAGRTPAEAFDYDSANLVQTGTVPPFEIYWGPDADTLSPKERQAAIDSLKTGMREYEGPGGLGWIDFDSPSETTERKSAGFVVSKASGNLAFVINYNDGPNEGFNDPTIGAQRKAAFEAALQVWSDCLAGDVPVAINATLDPLAPGVLGSCGPLSIARNFANAPRSNIYYAIAQANQLAGMDLNPAISDIAATFSSDFNFYYGTDGNPGPGQYDFYTIILHEICHGLGFLSGVSSSTGGWEYTYPFVFDCSLQYGTLDFLGLSNANRLAAIVSGDLWWNGSKVLAARGDRVKMFAPNPYQPGSSVSHFDTSNSPNLLMEPAYTGVMHSIDSISKAAMEDMDWTPFANNVKSFTIYNDGADTLSVSAMALDTATAWIAWSPPAPLSIAPGSGETVTLTIDKASAPAGTTYRQLIVSSNDPDESETPLDLAILNGAAPVPDIRLDPGSLSFDLENGGATSQFVAIHNDGSAPLAVSGISLDVESPWLSWAPPPPYDIAAGGSQTITVSVDQPNTPLDDLARTMYFASDDPDENPAALVVGISNRSPDIRILPSSLTYDIAGATSMTQSFEIFNGGVAALNISDLSLNEPGDWISWTAGATPFAIAPSETREVFVAVDGAKHPLPSSSRQLRIASNDPDDGLVSVGIWVTKTPGEPDIRVEPMALSFDLRGGAPPPQTFTIFNDGVGELHVSAFEWNKAAPWLGCSPDAPFIVPAGGSLAIEAAAPSGQVSRQLSIASDDADENPTVVTITVDDGVQTGVESPLWSFYE